MKHLDLFSGIGGFALAIEMAFPDEEIQHIFCDNEPFSQAILKKHWPNSLIYDDIKTLTADRIIADTECGRRDGGSTQTEREDGESIRQGSEIRREAGGQDREYKIDLLTGGFPCQPFSAAGRRAGTEDDRHLWPEMLRVIRETNPEYILGENVGGLLTWDGGLVLEMVLADLEEAGYEAGAFVIPAAAVGAPHRRDRVWIAAHSLRRHARRHSREYAGAGEEERVPERNEMEQPREPGAIWDAGNADSTRTHARSEKSTSRSGSGEPDRDDADTIDSGLEGREHEEAAGHGGQPDRSGSDQGRNWIEDWPQVAARLCTLDDGLPDGLARPRGWRNAALKGAGNAIVPQVAAEILRSMITDRL